MPLPSRLTYNDLSGDEIKHILTERFVALLAGVPYLQRHITLPRVKMELQLKFSSWADSEHPDSMGIFDSVEILSDKIDASTRGKKPDQIREEHNLPIPTPVLGPVAVEDNLQPATVENTRMEMANGAVVDRTGKAPGARKGATVVEQDFGPAGLQAGKFERGEMDWRNKQQRDGGEVYNPFKPNPSR